ncbi:hypothetical protein ACLOJK_034163 [Asimina triloba]
MSNTNALVNGLAGAGGGIIAQIITYPLQTVNTRQQTERIAKKKKQKTLLAPAAAADASSSSTTSSPAPTATSTNGGTFFQILQVITMEGWGGLYSGLKPSLFGTAASQGIYYYFYQVFKNKAMAVAATRKKRGLGDGTVGMFSWLVVAALAGMDGSLKIGSDICKLSAS